MAQSEWRKGEPIDKGLQQRLVAFIGQQGGVKEAADLLGLTRHAVGQAALGERVRKTTAIAIAGQLQLRTSFAA